MEEVVPTTELRPPRTCKEQHANDIDHVVGERKAGLGECHRWISGKN